MTRSPNPIPLRPEHRSGPRAAVHFERAAIAAVMGAARPTYRGADAAVRKLFPSDEVAPILLRSATAPATTTASAWAGVLAQQAVGDFIASLAPMSVGARLINAGARVSLDGRSVIQFPRRQGIAATDVAWVAEGAPLPTRQLTLANTPLGPARKLGLGVVLTREVIERSAAEEIVRIMLREDAAASLDAALFSTLAATEARPAGLLNGVTPIAATAGGGFDAFSEDLKKLVGAIADAGGGDPVFIMNARQALVARLHTQADITVWATPALAAGTVVAIEPRAFASAFGPEPDIKASTESIIHLEDSAPLQIGTAGSPATIAAPTRSAFQTDAVVLRAILDAAWTMRAPGMVQFITGATW